MAATRRDGLGVAEAKAELNPPEQVLSGRLVGWKDNKVLYEQHVRSDLRADVYSNLPGHLFRVPWWPKQVLTGRRWKNGPGSLS